MHCDLDLWPFDLKIYRAHPWLMGSLHVKLPASTSLSCVVMETYLTPHPCPVLPWKLTLLHIPVLCCHGNIPDPISMSCVTMETYLAPHPCPVLPWKLTWLHIPVLCYHGNIPDPISMSCVTMETYLAPHPCPVLPWKNSGNTINSFQSSSLYFWNGPVKKR